MDNLPKVLNLYKGAGETPLERLEKFRAENSNYMGVKLSYVGRLDPLAEGVMLVVVGEENKSRDKYLELDKEYEVEVLFGVETDTGDILGIINDHVSVSVQIPNEKIINAELKYFIGKHLQKYPKYSSKTVKGKPLWQWAREGKLEYITVPEREVEISNIEFSPLIETVMKSFEGLG